MAYTEEPDLFGGEIAPVSVPHRRPVGDRQYRWRAQYHQVLPGQWVVVIYSRSPKQGWHEDWEFPMFWSESGWSAPWDDGDVADGTFWWPTRAEAVAAFEECYPPGEPFIPGMLRFPSYDQRRARKS